MNNTLRYLINNMKVSIEAIAVIASVFVIQLVLTSEIWAYFFPTGSKSLTGACYGFEVAEFEESDLKEMILGYPSNFIEPLDIQLAGYGTQKHFQIITSDKISNEEFRSKWLSESPTDYILLYAPLTPLSKIRIDDKGSYDPAKVNSASVVLLNRGSSSSDIYLGDYVYISEKPFQIVGTADIFETTWDHIGYKYICNVDAVLETTSDYEVIFQFKEPLNASEYQKLLSYVDDSLEVTATNMPYLQNAEQRAISGRLLVEAIILVMVCLCLITGFIGFVIDRRHKEFNIYRICGARSSYIVKLIILHISFLCAIAELISWSAFVLIVHCTKLTPFDGLSVQFVLINSMAFGVILVVVMLIYLFVDNKQTRRLGLSRTAR